MRYLIGQKNILMFFFVLVFLEKPTMGARKSDFFVDLFISGRDEMVSWAGYGEDKLSTVVIGGKILCHGRGAREKASYPVSGARVSVVCGWKKKGWAKSRTDAWGNFVIDVPSHLHATPKLDEICEVQVVGLPKSCHCSSSTRKHNPIQLISIANGIRSYSTHTIHLSS